MATTVLEHGGDAGIVRADNARLAERLDVNQIAFDAAKADERNHNMGFIEAIKKHKKAAAWSAMLSLALVMEGYDLVIINSFYGQAQFIERYGTFDETLGKKIITTPWQTGLSNAALCGEIIGLMINGYATDRFGYRRTYMSALVLMACAVFATFFATSLPVLAFGEVLCGIPWGMFQTLSTAFAAEVTPIALRGYLSSWVNICWGMGIFISSGVARAAIEIPDEWAYRMPFALQWIWPVPLFIGAYFVPESPWWLARNGKDAEALHSIQRLQSADTYTEEIGQSELALIKHTIAVEEIETAGASYLNCFRKSNYARTEAACVVWAIQWLCGNPLIGFAVLFLQRAGLNETASYDFNLSMNSMYIVGTIISWFLMARFGRRSLYIAGIGLMGLVCLIIGVVGFVQTSSASLAIGVLMIVLNLSYNVSIGPVCYAIVSEIGSSQLRAKTVVLARTTYNLTGLVTNTLTPRMINGDAWNWGAKTGLFYTGLCVLCGIYCFFRLPETKGRSFGEIDLLYENKVPQRRFKSTQVDQFGLVSRAWTSGSRPGTNSQDLNEKDNEKSSI